jgi:hypothetical protein
MTVLSTMQKGKYYKHMLLQPIRISKLMKKMPYCSTYYSCLTFLRYCVGARFNTVCKRLKELSADCRVVKHIVSADQLD